MSEPKTFYAKVLKALETQSFEEMYLEAGWDDRAKLCANLQRICKLWREHLSHTGRRGDRELWGKLDSYMKYRGY